MRMYLATLSMAFSLLHLNFACASEAKNSGPNQSIEQHDYTDASIYGTKNANHLGTHTEFDKPMVLVPFHFFEQGAKSDFEPRGLLGIPYDGWVAIFTGLLFASTAGLWFATLRSVRIAERAVTELERPYVFAHIETDAIERLFGNAVNIARHELGITFQNFGRSPAQLKEVMAIWQTIPRAEMPPAIDARTHPGIVMPIGAIASPDFPFRYRPPDRHVKDINESLLQSDRTKLFVTGFIRYTDVFQTHYLTGFCAVWRRESNSFNLIGDQRYNYSVIVKSPYKDAGGTPYAE